MKMEGIKISSLKHEDTQVKILSCGLIIFLILVLIPLFQISHYNFMKADDYGFASGSVAVWQDTHSVWKVLGSQIKYTYDIYHSWQGTYFSMWLITSLLGFFSQDAYFVCTYLTLGGLVVCELFSFVVVLRKVLGADYSRTAIIAVSCISMQVLLTTVPVEAYYWFTGAVVYTFIYALTVLLVACMVMLYNSKLSGMKCFALNVVLAILNIAIGGSNYVTALCTFLIYLFSLAYFFVRRHKLRFVALGQFGFYLAAFLLNVMAPGNHSRQSASGMEHLPALKSILLSCKEAAEYLIIWTHLPVIIMGVLLVPIILKITKKRGYRYPFPAFVSVISFGLFAAQFTPTIYALGITGAGRVLNLYRFSMFILLYGNEIYWLGWLQRRWGCANEERDSLEVSRRGDDIGTSWVLPAWLAGGLILLFSLYIWANSTLTTISAWESLRRGEAQQYYKEYQERCEILEDCARQEVALPPYSVTPYLLYFGDIVEDPSDWVNQSVANWYHKASVFLQE